MNRILSSIPSEITGKLARFLLDELACEPAYTIREIPSNNAFNAIYESEFRKLTDDEIKERMTVKFHLAVINGHHEIVARIVKLKDRLPGFNIDALCNNKRTALLNAILERQTETAQTLIALGANIHADTLQWEECR